jgi:hypothetical protein
MKKCFVSCLIILVFLLMSSCTSRETIEAMPGIDIPLAEYNTKFVITLWPGTPNAIKNGGIASLVLHNQSGISFVFSNDYGVKIFEKQSQGWKPVENRFEYPNVKYLLQTSTGNPGGLAFEASPFDPELKSPATVRIILIGHVKDKPDETVGAFIDMEINP